ncbi:hypothetical protein SeMB42_g07316 [Synchytrium endobioticum]|uniref:Uncharacterized protein n=1 Tax=Synchytrium endobioticum TaxID=286115 RepID=A0A507C4X4_9FUNG|nr:hypothetical protein SeMB42_g07316 [Synchytrium endobioticum]
MADRVPILFTILKTVVLYSLDRQLSDNAIFFAERLRCFYPAEEDAIYLVAKAYYAAAKPSVAAYVLRQQVENHVPSAYLFARACFDLERYHEGQEALERLLDDKPAAAAAAVNVPHEYSSVHPDTASIHCVMGELCRNGNKKDDAKTHYLTSFELNPFLWTSYEQLCRMNHRFDHDTDNPAHLPDLSAFFTQEKLLACYMDMIKGMTKLESALPQHNAAVPAQSAQMPRDRSTADQPSRLGLIPATSNGLSVANVSAPTLTERPRRTTATSSSTQSKASRSTTRSKTNSTGSRSINSKSKDPPSLGVKKPKGVEIRKITRSQTHALRSSNNNVESPNLPLTTTTRGVASKETTFVASALDTNVNANAAAVTMDTEPQPGQDELDLAMKEVLHVLTCMAQACLKLSQNHCIEAIEMFENLPVSQQESGWVLSHIGQARYQLGEFAAADQVFSELRKREPYRMSKMDLYSTVLWQMKQDVKLSYLAHQLVEFDRWSPEAWCAVGNCFSIKFDHMAALKCFQRAIQLSPSHAYSYYLSGMEWMALGDAERAQASYRNAIKVDDRHYNAWFGLGLIYYRQESYDQAEFHFRRAATINPSNPSLQSYIALVMQKTKRYTEALEYFDRADRLSRYPNVLTKFRRAFVLVLLNRNQEALDELHKLELQAQGECNVYYLMGKVYRRLGQNHRAIHYLTMAQDHQVHQSTNIIKDAIDKVSGGMEEDDPATFDELFKKFE